MRLQLKSHCQTFKKLFLFALSSYALVGYGNFSDAQTMKDTERPASHKEQLSSSLQVSRLPAQKIKNGKNTSSSIPSAGAGASSKQGKPHEARNTKAKRNEAKPNSVKAKLAVAVSKSAPPASKSTPGKSIAAKPGASKASASKLTPPKPIAAKSTPPKSKAAEQSPPKPAAATATPVRLTPVKPSAATATPAESTAAKPSAGTATPADPSTVKLNPTKATSPADPNAKVSPEESSVKNKAQKVELSRDEIAERGHLIPTVYYFPKIYEDNVSCDPHSVVGLHGENGKTIVTVCPSTRNACLMQGSCKVVKRGDNYILNYVGNVKGQSRYIDISRDECLYGLGIRNSCLDPYYTLAADRSYYKSGDVIYVPTVAGLELPNGSKHDGFFVVRDVGRRIKGRGRFDFYTGFTHWASDQNPFSKMGLADKSHNATYYRITGSRAEQVKVSRGFPGLLPTLTTQSN